MPGRTAPDGQPFPENLTTRRFDGGIVARLPMGSASFLTLRSSGLGQWHKHTFGPTSERDFHHTWFSEGAMTGQRGRHTWVVGAALQRDKYTARDLPAFDYNHVVPGVFAQDDFPVTSWLAVSASARGDFHNEFGNFFSPRISALLRSSTGWTTRLSTGTGFIAPTPFIEETEAAGLSQLRPLGNLAAERGRSVSFDVGWKGSVLGLNATLCDRHHRRARAARQRDRERARACANTRLRADARYHVEGMDLIATHMYVWTRSRMRTMRHSRSPWIQAHRQVSIGCKRRQGTIRLVSSFLLHREDSGTADAPFRGGSEPRLLLSGSEIGDGAQGPHSSS